jgi:hypothetical protein
MGRHNPIPTCQFNEASTHYLAPGMLGRWGQWGEPTISQSMWPPFQCHMCNSVTYPILRHMLGYSVDQQLHHECHLMTLGVQVRLLISWHEFAQ